MSLPLAGQQLSLFDMQGRRVLVLGLGLSGLASVRYALLREAKVEVIDTREQPPFLADLNSAYPQASFRQSALADIDCEQYDLIIWSPGISIERGAGLALAQAASKAGVAIVGELDIFVQAMQVIAAQAQERQAQENARSTDVVADQDDAEASASIDPPEPVPTKILAVTGTNGKTTVCSLAAEMAGAVGVDARAVGNIGASMLDAWCDAWQAGQMPQIWILELSSFQLALTRQFDPDVAVILNVTADHLDWHDSFASYATAKRKIAGARTHLILPRRGLPAELDLPELVDPKDESLSKTAAREAARAAANAPPRTYFGTSDPVNEGDTGLVRDNGIIWLAEAQSGDLPGARKRNFIAEPPVIKRLMPVDVLPIKGEHNHLNALAAIALCRAAGLPMAGMLHALRQYRGEPHRCQLIARIADVNWYDDSKGTNVGATCAALDGLDQKAWLIAGGVAKDQDFAPLAKAVRQQAAGVILFGQDAGQIRLALGDTGVTLLEATDLNDAVTQAGENATSGQAVLLSPACSSFDMFRNYQERGQAYVQAVQAYGEERGVVMEMPC
ncbi:MAG: UDP-N-acetylmuramoyl-L-alanine--D-glutamate ligase [Burkholderiaceae bacterium]